MTPSQQHQVDRLMGFHDGIPNPYLGVFCVEQLEVQPDHLGQIEVHRKWYYSGSADPTRYFDAYEIGKRGKVKKFREGRYWKDYRFA